MWQSATRSSHFKLIKKRFSRSAVMARTRVTWHALTSRGLHLTLGNDLIKDVQKPLHTEDLFPETGHRPGGLTMLAAMRPAASRITRFRVHAATNIRVGNDTR